DGKELKIEVDKLETSKKELVKLKETYEKANHQCEQLEKEMTKHEQAYQQLNTEYATNHAVYQDRIQNITEEVRVLSALEKQLKEAENVKVKKEQALETVRKNLQQAKEEQTKAN